jgi:Arc-like DNA binding dprotein
MKIYNWGNELMATKDVISFQLRIPSGLRRQLERAAKKNNRSANSEAVDRLTRSLQQDQEGTSKPEASPLDKGVSMAEARELIASVAKEAAVEAAVATSQHWFRLVRRHPEQALELIKQWDESETETRIEGHE